MSSIEKQSAVSSSTAGTRVQAMASSSSSTRSPITPLKMSRIQEKNTLASLNDRLAACIGKNQQFEREKAAICKQLVKREETLTRNITRGRETYDQELIIARRIIDDTAKDRVRLELETAQLKKDLRAVEEKLERKTKDAAAAARNLSQLDARFQDLTAQRIKLGSEKDDIAREKKELEYEEARLSRELRLLRRQLKHEMLQRFDIENRLKSKEEEVAFQIRCREEEKRRFQEILEVDEQLQQEYKLKLLQSIQELRAEHEAQWRANKCELDGLYEQKNADLRAQLTMLQKSSNSRGEKMDSLSSRCDSLNQQNLLIESERNSLLNQIKDLERRIDLDHSRFATLLNERDIDIERVVAEKSALISGYQDLLETKVALVNEISMYRKLLEGEEKRLSPKGTLKRDETTTAAGKGREIPLRMIKRKRTEREVLDSVPEYETDAIITQGDIEISEDDPEGKFIRLHNRSGKEVSISGWYLMRISGDIDTTYWFSQQARVEARATITVWSSDAIGGVHEPPQNTVMKGQKWYPSEHFNTVLTNSNGDQQAIRKTKRRQVSQQRNA